MTRNNYEYQKLRGLKRKLHLIDLRGGRCEKCGYNKNIAGFDFHHKDPTQKKVRLDMRKLSNSKMELILEEFEKCELLCANCHREEHSPELGLDKVRLLMESVDDRINTIRDINKPNCVDCGVKINYTSTRCKSCSYKNKRKVERPDLILLQEELDTNGVTWCSKKYGVSRESIYRWLDRQIQ